MTLEEYDSKKELRNAIDEIDKALHSISKIMEEDNGFGISPLNSRILYASNISDLLRDQVFAKRLKKLLIERKKELVEEFSR